MFACSVEVQGSQFCLPHEYSISGSASAGAKKLARSQPLRLPKFAPGSFEAVVERRATERACGAHLAVGPGDGVVQAEDLRDPVVQPLVVAVERREAAYVDAGQVHRRLAVHDPLGQGATGTARARDADRVESRGYEEVPHLRRLAEDELVVRGEALRAVVELADARLLERRDPVDCVLHQRREVLPVLLEQRELERVGDRVRRDPGLRVGLEAAHHQAADLLLEVGVAVGVAQHRQIRVHAVERVGDDVEVLRGVQRHVHPGQRPDGLRPLAGAVHDHLGLDVARVGAHAGDAPVLDEHVEHPGLLQDPGSPLPGALRQCGGQVGRVGLAVAGQPDGADEVVHAHHGVVLERLLGGEQLALEVEGGRGCCSTTQLGHPVLGACDRHSAAALEAGGQADLLLELGVELRWSTAPAGCRSGSPAAGRRARPRARSCRRRAHPARAGRRRCGRAWSGGRRRWCRSRHRR